MRTSTHSSITHIVVALHVLLAIMTASAPGCGMDTDTDTDHVADSIASSGHTLQTMNGLRFEELLFNAVFTNPAAMTYLLNHELSSSVYQDGTTTEALLLREQLLDPYARTTMKYLISCALGDNDEVVWQSPHSTDSQLWRGSLGLCTDWHDAPMPDSSCRERVSACILARQNAFSQRVALSMRGPGYDQPELSEESAYPWREGAFYGDLLDPLAIAPGLRVWVQDDPGADEHEIRYEYRRGGQLNNWAYGPLSERDTVHHMFLNSGGFTGVVFTNMYSCWSSVWTAGAAYAQARVCAGLTPDGDTCAANPVGPCETAAASSGMCEVYDGAPYHGDGDYADCYDDDIGQWSNVATVFLPEPCAIVADHDLCGVASAPQSDSHPAQ
jgi:hypothetical protein